MSNDFDPMTIAARQPSESALYDEEGAMARTLDALAKVAQAQADAPACVLCGQRVTVQDSWGLCSKIADSHRVYRDTHTRLQSMTSARKVRRS